MIRILFVDDERAVLDGLRDVLRRFRREWDMAFAVGGHEALAALDDPAFDVIVSDMRMPGMDGAELLRRAREISPESARVALTGEADAASILRTIPFSHRLLHKPCDVGALHATVEGLFASRERVASPSLREVVGRVGVLPTVPSALDELTHAAGQGGTGADALRAVIERDPAMAARLLHLAGSEFYGVHRGVASISQAFGSLGLDVVRELARAPDVLATTTPADVPAATGYGAEEVRRSSLLCVAVVHSFGLSPTDDRLAATAALLHQVGRLALGVGLPEACCEVARRARGPEGRADLAEREVLGASQAEVGAYLLDLWGAPRAVVDAVASQDVPDRASNDGGHLAAALHVAVHLVEALWLAPRAASSLDVESLGRAGMLDRLPKWTASAERLREQTPGLVSA